MKHRNRSCLARRAALDFLAQEDGQSLVEFSLTFVVLMALIFVLLQSCLAFYTFEMISEAAREGTRYAAVHGATCVTAGGSSCTATAASVNSYVSGLGWPNIGGGSVTPSTTYPNGNENVGSQVQVQITYKFPLSLLYVHPTSITLTSTSNMVILQ